MKKVAVIGLGNIGKRHLQSLITSNNEFEVFGVEINEISYNDIKLECTGAIILNSIEYLPEHLDLCIIATSSSSRRIVFEELVNHSEVRSILFEKVLFQKISDYTEVWDRLQEKKITAWVNCARREWSSYMALKTKFKNENWKWFSVTGGEWGLCCNCIHMVDLIQYLSGCENIYFSSPMLIPGIFDSKRSGYKEMYGTISGMCGNDIVFQISCTKDAVAPVMLVLYSDATQLVIEEVKGRAHIARKEDNWQWETIDFQTEYQSALTGRVAKHIIETGNCNLPTYGSAMQTHMKYIEMWLREFRLHGWESEVCPIT